MYGWVAIASATDVTLADAVTLGVPDRHVRLSECDCIELEWTRPADTARYVVAHAAVRELRQEVTEAGRHDLSLVLSDGTALPLEQAPCHISTTMAHDYAAAFAVPVTGSGVGVACVDFAGRIGQYMTPVIKPFVPPTYGRMASLIVSVPNQPAEHQLDLQDAWASERPFLAGCFAGGASGRAVFSGRIERDGTLDRMKVEVAGPTPEIEACLADRVGHLSTSDGKKRRVVVEVALAPAATPVSP